MTIVERDRIVEVPKLIETVRVIEVNQIVDRPVVTERVVQVTNTEIVYRQPNLSEVLAKIAELRSKLIFDSTVKIADTCIDVRSVPTSDLPTFLNSIEGKLTAIEVLICDKEKLEPYSLGSFSEPATVTLQDKTRFIKISVDSFPKGISVRFGRTSGQPNNYPFGFVAFENDLGLAPEENWEWVESYFYPDKENNPSKVHVYSSYPKTQYSITGYKPKS